jgi:hypothetical protein
VAVTAVAQACVLRANCCKTQRCLWRCLMPNSHVLELQAQVRMQGKAAAGRQFATCMLCWQCLVCTSHAGQLLQLCDGLMKGCKEPR